MSSQLITAIVLTVFLATLTLVPTAFSDGLDNNYVNITDPSNETSSANETDTDLLSTLEESVQEYNIIEDVGYGVIGTVHSDADTEDIDDNVIVPGVGVRSDSGVVNSTTTSSAPANTTEATTNVTCNPKAACFSKADCGMSSKAICLGAFVGSCNCASCITGKLCKADEDCGGLKGGCAGNGFCNCAEGYKANGFANLGDALLNFCNHKQCNGQNADDVCFGLPCHFGHCVC